MIRLLKKLLSTVAVGIGAAFIPTVTAFASPFVVQPGQTFWKISQATGVSISALEQANPAINPLNLIVGTRLQIPSSSANASSTPSMNSQDLYWMEHVINAEAGGESRQAQIAVGDVILNRLRDGGYGNSVHDVVFQISNGHYQFTSVLNGYIYTQPNASSIQAAQSVLNGTDIVPGALVFYNPAKTGAQSWVWSQPTVAQYGNLVFAK